MRSAVPLMLVVLLAVAAMGGNGCAHSQVPERKIYVISEEAGGVGGSGFGHEIQP